MFLKIMSEEDAADSHPCKSFRIFSNVESVDFSRPSGGVAQVEVKFIGDSVRESFYAAGNCYLMNDEGKTIANFGVAQIAKAA